MRWYIQTRAMARLVLCLDGLVDIVDEGITERSYREGDVAGG